MTGPYEIAIAGCGIGGLAIAALLRQSGHRVTILDQFIKPGPVGSGLVIQPVGQDVLKKIGAYAVTAKLGIPIYHMIGHEASSQRKVLDVKYGNPGGTTFGLGIHRASLFDALFEAALAQSPVLKTGQNITGTRRQGETRFVTCAGGIEHGPFDLVIDAAGASSPLSPLKGKSLTFGALWGTVDWPEGFALPANHLTQTYRRANKMIGALPIGTHPGEDIQKTAIFWSLPRGDYTTWQETPLQNWKDEITQLWPDFAPLLETITSHDDMTFSEYSHGTLRRPYGNRLVHIGDAAHRASPQLGQGANMALLDAACLAEAIDSYPLEKALKTYVRDRRIHTGIYQLMSWAFTPMYQSQSLVLPVIRDHVMAPLSTLPGIRHILTRLVCGHLTRPYAAFER